MPKPPRRQGFKTAFPYHPVFLPGKDKMPFRKVASDRAQIETLGWHEAVCVERESLQRAQNLSRSIGDLQNLDALDAFRCPDLDDIALSGFQKRLGNWREPADFALF